MYSYSEAFYLAIAGMIFAFLGVCVGSCQKLKCEHVNLCWGCISVHRNVQAELNENEEKHLEITQQQPRGLMPMPMPLTPSLSTQGDPITNALTNIGTNLATGAATHLVNSVCEIGKRESGKVDVVIEINADEKAAEEKTANEKVVKEKGWWNKN